MTSVKPIYDLVILLDPELEQDTRAKILEDTRAAIEAQGELLRQEHWGEKQLSYPIDHKAVADYQLLQLHATPELLAGLERTLKITDGVLRFRIIKLAPGVPQPSAAADANGSQAPTARAGAGEGGEPGPSHAAAPEAPGASAASEQQGAPAPAPATPEVAEPA